MGAYEFIKEINEAHPYLPWIVAGVGAITGYIIGRLHGHLKAEWDQAGRDFDKQLKDLEHKEKKLNCTQTTIAHAVRTDDEYSIEGIIKESYLNIEGYSGMIQDRTGKIPFFFDDEEISESEEDGLVPIILNHSKENQQPIRMNGYFDQDSKIFVVDRLMYNMNGIDYDI